jgi:hypothetical protein
VPALAKARTGLTTAAASTKVNITALRQTKVKLHIDVPSTVGASEGFEIAFGGGDF